MKFAVVVFPGSNCDHDAYHAAKHVLGQDAELVWHKDASLRGADVVILPGGFAHGDYLRTGAIASDHTIVGSGATLDAGARASGARIRRTDPSRVGRPLGALSDRPYRLWTGHAG